MMFKCQYDREWVHIITSFESIMSLTLEFCSFINILNKTWHCFTEVFPQFHLGALVGGECTFSKFPFKDIMHLISCDKSHYVANGWFAFSSLGETDIYTNYTTFFLNS